MTLVCPLQRVRPLSNDPGSPFTESFYCVLTATLVDPRVTLPPSLKRTKTRFAASSKGHRAASLDEDPKGWRGVGVDRRRHGRTDCRDALPVAQGRVDETNLSHRLTYSVKRIVVKLIVSRLTYAETRISRL